MTLRRTILSLASLATLSLATIALAQQPKVWTVGVLASSALPAQPDSHPNYGAFVAGMRDLGYVEGKNVHYVWRAADGKYDRLGGLVGELVGLKVDVLVTSSTAATRAAQRATKTIPIVMVSVGDPVGSGFATSLARPGANLTGMGNLSIEFDPKRLELLLSALPKAARVAALLNPNNPTYPWHVKTLGATADKAGAKLTILDVRSPDDIVRSFPAMAKAGMNGVYVHLDPLLGQYKERIASLAIAARLPTVCGSFEYVDAGSLMSYGPRFSANYRRLAVFVDKILKGAKPADLPIELPTEMELVVNAKTAKAIGIELPSEIMFRATRVIE